MVARAGWLAISAACGQSKKYAGVREPVLIAFGQIFGVSVRHRLYDGGEAVQLGTVFLPEAYDVHPTLSGGSEQDSMGFGGTLKDERERRGISLEDIATATRISLRHLSALETDNFRELPGGVFNRGIVRSYARTVGIDEDETLNQFQEAVRVSGVEAEPHDADWTQFAEAVRKSRSRSPERRIRWAGVAGMLLAVLLLSGGVLWYLMFRGIVQHPRWLPVKVRGRLATPVDSQ